MLGKITDIETMGLVDGPGMRLVIFLSGCRLRCLYCHNPETWDINGFTKQISSQEVLELYNKYKNYYGENGGVTFSGGEPLLQHDFLLETIKLLKENNVHIALDTAGVGDEFEDVLNLVDLVILDVKAVEDDEYKRITGQDKKSFDKFLQKCIELNKKIWLRQVVVPTINDDEEHMLLLKEFAEKIPNVERIELLPYHSLGVHKYQELGITYRLDGVEDMDKEKCKKLEGIVNKK